MESLGIFVLACAIACGYCEKVSGDGLLDLIEAGTAFYQTGATYYDPLVIEDDQIRHNIPVHFYHIVNGTVGVTNLTYSGFKNLVLDSETTDPSGMKAQVVLKLPNITVSTDYEYEGTLIGRKASGKGHLRYSILNTTVAMNPLQLIKQAESYSLAIESLGLTVDVKDVEFRVDGLKVHGMMLHLFEKAFEIETKLLLKALKIPLDMFLERKLVDFANIWIAGRSMAEVTAWLNDNQYYCQKHGC